MPRHTRSSSQTCTTRENLLTLLAAELKNPAPIGQPIILEDYTDQTGTMRVHVIWDRWEECPREMRSDIILNAYLSLAAEARARITLALGVTLDEAVGIGLLPFQVIPVRKSQEGPLPKDYHDAMIRLEARPGNGDGEPELRFATLDDAQAGVERLEQILPGSKWVIKQEVYAS
jgi:hypothetical protein